MDKALNEIGKLRNEMKVGFIELQSQMRSNQEKLETQMRKNTEKTMNVMEKFSNNVDKGFIAIEEALDRDLSVINKEINQIKKRLDDANI